MPKTNKKILKRLTKGDQCAFEQIYYAYSKKLYHYGLGLLKNPEEASEMVQDVFVTLWEKRERVNPNLNFENYLITMGYNSIRKIFRKRSNKRKVIDNLMEESSGITENTENSVIFNDFYNKAQASIEKMPPKRKMVYKLNRQEGMSAREIAEELGISKRTVEGHLAEALSFLKTELAKYSIHALLLFSLFLS
jgi:RNA polymerase sigma-70 factor (ECF subfamily)